MSNELIIKNSITINAPAAEVWDALVNPEQTKQYMFGCEAISDWKIGSPLLWKGNYEGNEMIFVKGVVNEIHPEKFLEFTVIDPNSGIADIPENYLTVTYTLEPGQAGTTLTVTQGDYAKVGDGQKRYEDSMQGGGWDSILTNIKNMVEDN